MWATDPSWTHAFVSPEAISSNSITVGGATWSVSTTAGAGTPTISIGTYSKTYGLKFGNSKSEYYGSVTFTTDYFKDYNVKSVTVNILNNGSKKGTLTAQQGATSIGSASSTFGTTWTDLTVNTNAGSGGTLSFTYSVEQAFYIHSITVTYTTGGGGGDTNPSISLSPSSVNATKEGKNGTINVTYSNIDPIDSEVLFYESNGTTAATYNHDWITASINGDKNIAYSISANTSYARTAYMKVHQKNTEVYSGLITVTQDGAIYTVNIQTPTGGTLEVKDGETPISNGDAVNDGTTLTITATASDGYRFKNWQAVDASTHTNTATFTYTINKHDVTIKANFDVEYSVNWSVNGNVVSTGIYVNNETIVFPNRPADIVGKKFVGWTATEIDGTQVETPTLLDYGTKMGTSNLTYYAVFADASGESSTATLTGSEISSNFASAQMSYGTEKTYTDTSDGVTWVGCGNTDAASRPWVQLRSKNDAYFKISTLKNIEEVKLTISNTTNQSGGILDISKHGAFVGKVCLESEAKSTPTGAYASSDVVSDNIVTVSIPVSLKEFYIQTTAAARVWGIELSTNNYTYSNYRTTVPTTATITLNDACTDGNYVYGTYSNSQSFVVTDDIVVSEVGILDGKLVVDSYDTGDVVPANTGVMVAALAGGNYNVTLSAEAGTSVLGSDNMLKPSGDAGITAANMTVANTKFYRLTMHDGTKIGFWWGAADGAAFDLAANKAYLAIPYASEARAGLWFGEGDVTAIEAVKTQNVAKGEYFNLAGQRVAQPTKGLYIVNGRKAIVK